MKFERLNSSISLNSREAPSVYMAICMVESLFKDVELAAGTDSISRVPPGDEQMPTKLLWLARTILKIYEENSEKLQRNQDRLEKMMGKISLAEKELASQADTAQALAELRKRDEALELQLAEAEERRQETEELQKRCREAETQLQTLKQFDPAAAQRELTALEDQVRGLHTEYSGLKAKLERQSQDNEALQAACDELRQHCAQCQARRDQMTRERQEAEEFLRRSQAEEESCSSQMETLTRARKHMLEELAESQQQLAQMQQKNEAFQSEKLAPVLAALERQKSENEDQTRLLEARKQDWEYAVMDKSRLKKRLEEAEKLAASAQAELAQSRRRTEEAEDRADALQTQKEEALRNLEALQQEIEEYETNSLPELRGLIQTEEENRTELLRQLEEGRQLRESLRADIDRLHSQEEPLQEQLTELKQSHAELTSGLQAKTLELESLKQKLKELQGKNVQEQEMTFRRQLDADLKTLEASARACGDLKQELQKRREKLQQKQEELAQLQARKQEAERAEREVEEKLRVLLPYRDLKLRQQVQELQNRQKLLSETNERLEKSIDLMREVLDEPPELVTVDPEGLREALKKCGDALTHLQGSLVRTANATSSEVKLRINMEE